MKNIFLKFIWFSCILSCQNFDSEKYHKNENQAISDLILEMTNFEEAKKLNNFQNKKLKLYLASTLDTATAWTKKPQGYITAIDGIQLSKEQIKKNKQRYEIEVANYEKENQLFESLKNGKIKKRSLNHLFQNQYLKIELIEPDRIKSLETRNNEFGYLFISRIIFNKNFTKGYLHYEFFCGVGCAWNYNIEISKVKDKWVITDSYSGGIA